MPYNFDGMMELFDKNGKETPLTRKMSLSKKGKPKSEEHKKKLRKNLDNIRPKKGQIKWSDDAKKKHSDRVKRWHAERREKNSVQSH